MNQSLLSLVLSLAAPPECARDDLACTARTAAREAKDATDPRERAEARLTAARAHLALYQKTGTKDHLCRARRFVAGLRRTPELGALLPETREQIDLELTRHGITCPEDQRSPRSSPARPKDSPTASSEPSASAPSQEGQPVEARVVTESERAEPPLQGQDDLLPVAVGTHAPIVRAPPEESAQTPRRVVPPTRGPDSPDAGPPAGRRLLIAGGVLGGGAAMTAGLAAVAASRAGNLAAEQNAIAATTHDQGFTDPASRKESERLTAGVAQWERVLLGASLTCAVVGSAAVALLTAGVVKRHRAARVVAAPGFAGLLWTARF